MRLDPVLLALVALLLLAGLYPGRPQLRARIAAAAPRQAGLVLLWTGTALLWLMALQAWPLLPELERGALRPLLGLGLVLNLIVGAWPRIDGGGRLATLAGIEASQGMRWAALLLAPSFALLAALAAGERALAHAPGIAATAWLAAIALVLFGLWKGGPGRHELETGASSGAEEADRSSEDGAATRGLLDHRFAEPAILSLLFLLALLLRATALEHFPNLLGGDEGNAGLSALQVLDGDLNNPLGFGWYSFPALYFMLLAPFIEAFGTTALGLRLSSAIVGALSVPALYALGRLLFGRSVGLVAALLLASSHFHIHWSRIGLNNVWDSLFATLAVLGLWLGWQRGDRRAFLLCGLALGLGQYFYASMRALPILILLWSLIAWRLAGPRFRARFRDLSAAAYLALICALPILILYARRPNDFMAPFRRVSLLGPHLEHRVMESGLPAWRIVVGQLWTAFEGIVFIPLEQHYEPGIPLLQGGAALLFLAGLVWMLRRMRLAHLLILLPILSVILSSGLSLSPPASQRYVIAAPFIALVAALPLGLLHDQLRARQADSSRRAMAVGLLTAACLAWLAFVDLDFYFGQLYPGFVLGGPNAVAADRIADHLEAEAGPEEPIYFFGWPRMGFRSVSSLPFRLPQYRKPRDAETRDLVLDAPPELAGNPMWSLDGPSWFIFLPEREADLSLVEARYPGGRATRLRSELDGTLIAILYRVDP